MEGGAGAAVKFLRDVLRHAISDLERKRDALCVYRDQYPEGTGPYARAELAMRFAELKVEILKAVLGGGNGND